MKKKIIHLTLALIAGMVVICSCGKSYNSNNPTTTYPNGNVPVLSASGTIQNFAFSPSIIYLKTGGSVTWTNKDASAHTVTDVGGAFDSGSISTDQTYKFTFSTAGTFTYHCTIHSMMPNATVVVTN